MNIAQLLHNQKQIQSISHYSIFTINSSTKHWYFYSSKNCTLRKKVQNTNITAFLSTGIQEEVKYNSKNTENIQKQRGVLLQVREVDYRQPKNRELYEIKVTKLSISQIIAKSANSSDEQLIKHNNWKPQTPYQQISLYKICTENVIIPVFHSLLYSSNLIKCSIKITSHLQNKLTQYCSLISNKVQQKWLKYNKMELEVKQFQLVFTYDQKQGKIKIVFAHNFIIHCNHNDNNNDDNNVDEGKFNQVMRAMYATNFKVASDEHQRLELLQKEQQSKIKQIPKPIIFSDDQAIKQSNQQKQNLMKMINFPNHQLNKQSTFCQKEQKNRLKMLKLLTKFHQPVQSQLKHLQVAIKKQLPGSILQYKQFQCSACYCCVKLNQFQSQRMITSNRLKQVQMLRQIKMNLGKPAALGQYQIAPVCQLCYKKYLDIVNNADMKQITSKRENKKKLNKTDIISNTDLSIIKDDQFDQKQQNKQIKAIVISTEQVNLRQNVVPCTIKQQVRPFSSSTRNSAPFYINQPKTASNVNKSRTNSFMSKNRQITKDTIAQLDGTINRQEPIVWQHDNQNNIITRCTSKSTKNPSLFPSYNTMKARAARKSLNAQSYQQEKSKSIKQTNKISDQKVQNNLNKRSQNIKKQLKSSVDYELETEDDLDIALQEYQNWQVDRNVDLVRKIRPTYKDKRTGKYKLGYFK